MENIMKGIKTISFFLAIITTIPITGYTQTEETDTISVNLNKEIVFGQSAFLSQGSLQLYGELIRNAINARFNRINKQGGIQKKILRLISMDDRGEPEKTAQNIETMRKNSIDMFLGNMGTRNISKVLPPIEKKEIAMLFPWGGSDELRKPNLTYLVNGLGLIKPQINALVSHSLETLRLTKIAIFHDDSSFGIENKNMLVEELAKHKISPVAIASYNRFTMDIESPSRKLINADPKIVICSATSMPTVKLINNFFEHGHYGTTFIGIDSTMFVGTILKRRGVSFHYASPMPNPKTSDKPIVQEFRQDMKEYFPNDPLNILSLSYYIHAAIVSEALQKIDGPITKEKLLEQIQAMKNYDLGGFTVNFDPSTRHAYDHNISILEG